MHSITCLPHSTISRLEVAHHTRFNFQIWEEARRIRAIRRRDRVESALRRLVAVPIRVAAVSRDAAAPIA
ncbi:MAG: hypothetical protein CME06_17790 [Gemmatimonadetes bacterium]|nr:hypothetical protein [Gemmatimonadota bacterium]